MPERGEVWQVDFGITHKVRPALVISVPYTDRDRALIGLIPHTGPCVVHSSKFQCWRVFLPKARFWFKAFRQFHRSIFCVALAS